MSEPIDILENRLLKDKAEILRTLLFDHTTRQNIFWATNSYASLGEGFGFHEPITLDVITGEHGNVIRPRVVKAREEQQQRSREMAEVFTPSWLCNEMNNEADAQWFGRPDVFNTVEANHQWQPQLDAIAMPEGKTWQDYALTTRLEITCGEAPFLVSRYDTVTGEAIPLDRRIGILDRKLRVVTEQAADEDEWMRWALIALGSCYGYEWQGDSLLLAREAVVETFAEYFEQQFGKPVSNDVLKQAAEIVSWNLWQMDGLKGVVPCSCREVKEVSPSLFGESEVKVSPCPGCSKDDITLHNGLYCQLRRWLPSNSPFPDIITKKYKTYHKTKWLMKFDFIIGNPPYQEETQGTSDKPVYDKFMDATYKLSDKVELITPARFLFNAGKTQKAWNEKILSDAHFKILDYCSDSSVVFSNTDIKGGVAISYHDASNVFGPIEVFSKYPQLNTIRLKVEKKDFHSLSSIVYTSDAYHFTSKLHDDYPNAKDVLSNGHENDVTSNIFIKLPHIFVDEIEKKEDIDYLKFYGLIKTKRCCKWINELYVKPTVNLFSWKILFSKSNGSGAFGEKFAEPIIAEPRSGHTQTFISIGNFETKEEVINLSKYIKTKFARTLLGMLKVTQDNKKKVWKYVPLQDFTSSSDIDWTQDIHAIDVQLYDKYGLTEERNFIETHVKPME